MSPISATRGTVTAVSRVVLASVGTIVEPGSAPPEQGMDVRLRVTAGTVNLGGTAVVSGAGSGAGYQLVAGQPLSLNLDYGERLYGIRNITGTTVVQVLTSTHD